MFFFWAGATRTQREITCCTGVTRTEGGDALSKKRVQGGKNGGGIPSNLYSKKETKIPKENSSPGMYDTTGKRRLDPSKLKAVSSSLEEEKMISRRKNGEE